MKKDYIIVFFILCLCYIGLICYYLFCDQRHGYMLDDILINSELGKRDNFANVVFPEITRVLIDNGCSNSCVCSYGGIEDYGVSCGYNHYACRGVKPCDAYDSCCWEHDRCVTRKDDILDCDCLVEFKECIKCAYIWNVGFCGTGRTMALRTVTDITVFEPNCRLK